MATWVNQCSILSFCPYTSKRNAGSARRPLVGGHRVLARSYCASSTMLCGLSKVMTMALSESFILDVMLKQLSERPVAAAHVLQSSLNHWDIVLRVSVDCQAPLSGPCAPLLMPLGCQALALFDSLSSSYWARSEACCETAFVQGARCAPQDATQFRCPFES